MMTKHVEHKASLSFENRLDDSDFLHNKELLPILKAALNKQGITAAGVQKESLYWPESFYCLPQLELYQSLKSEERQAVLLNCNQITLEEAFYIEKSGMTYAAKMALMAESNDERALYSLFCADEASHFNAINSFMPRPARSFKRQAFLVLLDELLHHGSYPVLIYMIQVILEGWGLHHYRSLFQHCQNSELKQVLRSILNDEAKHHGSGLVLLPQKKWGRQDQALVSEFLAEFLELVRIGPLLLLDAIEDELGELERQDKAKLFSDWGGQVKIKASLDLLHKLMVSHCPDPLLVEKLEAKGLFQAAGLSAFIAYQRNVQ